MILIRKLAWGKSALIILLCIPLLLFVSLFYGPFPAFRELWINTAMNTSRHKYLAQWFYTDKYIAQVLETNRISSNKKTDEVYVKPSQNQSIQYSEVKGKYYTGYIIKIGDPSVVRLVAATSERGALLENLVTQADATGGINASGYIADNLRGIPCGYCVLDGRVANVASELYAGQKLAIGGMDTQNRLIVGSYTLSELALLQMRWAVEFGPVLVVNGEKTEITSQAGGLAPRTAIGQTQNGAILLLVVDGRQRTSIGATYADLQTILYANGAVNAIVLDGGSSSSMVYDGQLVNSPSNGTADRLLPNAIVYK